MLLETISLEHVAKTTKVHITLFTNVSNCNFLQSQLLARNSDFEYAFIDASSIVSRRQVLAAIYKAISCLQSDTLRTPNVHSETVTSLSPSNNIAESYRRFGISATTQHVAVVKVVFPTENRPDVPSPQQIWQYLERHVQGTPVMLTDENLAPLTDWNKVRKYYKLNGVPALNGLTEKDKVAEMELLVISTMALRGLTN